MSNITCDLQLEAPLPVVEDSLILAFSAASRIRWIAIWSDDRSVPESFLKSLRRDSVRAMSKSSPPK
jgi:hypothetical protein